MSEVTNEVGSGARRAWQAVQGAVFLVGVAIVAALLFAPKLGLFLLWDVLIPVAPLLLVVAPGLWRNVCPLGTFSLLPAHASVSKKRPISREWQSRLLAIAVLLLLVIVPLRHPLLDRYGVLTGIVLVAVAALALGLGFVFDLKSAWCSGLCPVYPVEMLYGSRPLVAVPNVQCRTCSNCVALAVTLAAASHPWMSGAPGRVARPRWCWWAAFPASCWAGTWWSCRLAGRWDARCCGATGCRSRAWR